MTYTTVTAIRAALETLIKGLDPKGKPMGRSSFKLCATGFEWDNRAETDVDRHFTVELIGPGILGTVGLTTEIDYKTTFLIKVGHKRSTNKKDSLARANEDLIQIQQNVEKKTNYPAGVALLRYESNKVDDTDEKYWVSELQFRIVYTLQAP